MTDRPAGRGGLTDLTYQTFLLDTRKAERSQEETELSQVSQLTAMFINVSLFPSQWLMVGSEGLARLIRLIHLQSKCSPPGCQAAMVVVEILRELRSITWLPSLQ